MPVWIMCSSEATHYVDSDFFGTEIRNTSTDVKIVENDFDVLVQTKTLAPRIHVYKVDLENCPAYKPLELYKQKYNQESNPSVLFPIVLSISLSILVVIVALIIYVKSKKNTTNTEIDQNPEYGQQEYYYENQQKRTNILEENVYYEGGAYKTD